MTVRFGQREPSHTARRPTAATGISYSLRPEVHPQTPDQDVSDSTSAWRPSGVFISLAMIDSAVAGPLEIRDDVYTPYCAAAVPMCIHGLWGIVVRLKKLGMRPRNAAAVLSLAA